jgi:hypothetical protein
MTIDNSYFYLQNRLIQTSQTGGQWYSDTSPFSIPWLKNKDLLLVLDKILVSKTVDLIDILVFTWVRSEAKVSKVKVEE